MSLQAKTLQLLQDGTYSRIGDTQERQSNTRIICATNRNLPDEIVAGRFRQDLFYRINVVTLNLPPLRERREDIPLLANYFLTQLKAKYEREAPPFSEEMLQAFTHQEWRGNVRELENLVARYAILGGLDPVAADRSFKRPLNYSFESFGGRHGFAEAYCEASCPRNGEQRDLAGFAREQMESSQGRNCFEHQLPVLDLQDSGGWTFAKASPKEH